MPDAVTLIATFSAGLLSFCAPCTIPLLPGFLAFVSGVGAIDLGDEERRSRFRGRMVAGTLLFVLGFSGVFVLLGVGAGGLGHGLRQAARPVEIIGGILMVVFGLAVGGVLRLAWLNRDWRPQLPERVRGAGPIAALPLGVVFGIGWTPCVGPYLASALALAAVAGHAGTGAILLGAYAIGLGMPFLLVALLWASFPGITGRASRLARPLAHAGGAVLVVLGGLLVSGEYSHLTSMLARLYTPAR